MGEMHSIFYKMGLVRSSKGRVLGGVCAGLADKLGADPWAIRLLVIATMVVIPGSPVILYPLLWALMPDEDYRPTGAIEGSGRGSVDPAFGDNPQHLPRRDEGPQDEIRR